MSPASGVRPRLLASYASTAGPLSRWDFGSDQVENLAIWWPKVPPATSAALCYLAGQFRTTDGRDFTTAIIEIVGKQAKLVRAGGDGETVLLTMPPVA